MKKLSYLLVPLIVLLCSCGGVDSDMNKYYNIPTKNILKTKKAIKLVKKQYIKITRPHYSVVRYTYLKDGFTRITIKGSNFQDSTIYFPYKYMYIQIKDKRDDRIFIKKFYFDRDIEFWTISKYKLESEIQNKYKSGKFSWEENK